MGNIDFHSSPARLAGTSARGTPNASYARAGRLCLGGLSWICLGLVVGIGTSYGQTYLTGPWAALANSCSAWLVAPFVVGAFTRSPLTGACAGAIACLAQLVGFDATHDLRGFAVGEQANVFWASCALVGGPVFGAFGTAWRRGHGWQRGLGAAALPGAFFAEGLCVYYVNLGAHATAALWAAIGTLLALVLSGRRVAEVHWIMLTFAFGCLGELALMSVYSQSV